MIPIKNKTNRGLTTEQMKTAIDIFTKCQHHVLHENNIQNDKEHISKWINETVLSIVPVVSLRADSIEFINDSIFKDETIRTFVFDLSFRFFSICNESDNFAKNLSVSISNGLVIDKTELSIIPNAIRQSLVSHIFSTMKVRRIFIF